MQEQKIQEPIATGCIAIDQFHQLIQQSFALVTIIDVRSPDEFTEKHIPGAINIPLTELEIRAKELSKDNIIITACGKGGGRSAQGAELLKQLGFSNANYLCGGTFGWYEKNDSLLSETIRVYNSLNLGFRMFFT
jgi:rhodanese-related sulfurtransferase